jgi:endonuclease/exonuclease/phosphatase family protein
VKSLAVVLAVLTYNVHGLPSWVTGDDTVARMFGIAPHLSAYDVVLIQESWGYFNELAFRSTHPVRERGNGPNPGLLWQNGLASFAHPKLVQVSRGSLGACSGWLGGANDCLADKGYLRLRLRLANGATVDFWNLHLDAGDGEDDRIARGKQLTTLQERVESLSGDSALVVAGDFNSQAREPADEVLLKSFVDRLGLVDSGARSAPEGDFRDKLIDYIFVRSGSSASLRVLQSGEAREFEQHFQPLSDHPALFARLEVTPP